jgi:dienelactone hydrolase
MLVVLTLVALAGAACAAGNARPVDDERPPPVPVAVDFSGHGPHPVGVLERSLGDRRLVVFYPADPDQLDGVRAVGSYSTRDLLPTELRGYVPVELTFDIELRALEDAPVNPEGPFPLVVYSHGEGGFSRVASRQFEHLASWGFVVASPEHSERDEAAVIAGTVDTTEGLDVRDLRSTIDAMRRENTRRDGTLLGSIDVDHVGAIGHGLGGRAVQQLASVNGSVGTWIAQAPAGEPVTSDDPASATPSLVLAGEADGVVPLEWVRARHEPLTPRRQLVVLRAAGHQSFTDLCAPIRERGGLAHFAETIPVGVEALEVREDGCTDDRLDPHTATRVLGHLNVAHLRWAFGLDSDRASLEPEFLEQRFPDAIAPN